MELVGSHIGDELRGAPAARPPSFQLSVQRRWDQGAFSGELGGSISMNAPRGMGGFASLSELAGAFGGRACWMALEGMAGGHPKKTSVAEGLFPLQ